MFSIQSMQKLSNAKKPPWACRCTSKAYTYPATIELEAWSHMGLQIPKAYKGPWYITIAIKAWNNNPCILIANCISYFVFKAILGACKCMGTLWTFSLVTSWLTFLLKPQAASKAILGFCIPCSGFASWLLCRKMFLHLVLLPFLFFPSSYTCHSCRLENLLPLNKGDQQVEHPATFPRHRVHPNTPLAGFHPFLPATFGLATSLALPFASREAFVFPTALAFAFPAALPFAFPAALAFAFPAALAFAFPAALALAPALALAFLFLDISKGSLFKSSQRGRLILLCRTSSSWNLIFINGSTFVSILWWRLQRQQWRCWGWQSMRWSHSWTCKGTIGGTGAGTGCIPSWAPKCTFPPWSGIPLESMWYLAMKPFNACSNESVPLGGITASVQPNQKWWARKYSHK